LTFGPLGEVIFTLTRDEYFILSRPLGEVYHILSQLPNKGQAYEFLYLTSSGGKV
jgi:hypothetical protein